MDKPASSPGLLGARAPLSGLSCPGCGQPLRGRQRACSNVCRAALSRTRRAQARQTQTAQVAAAATAAIWLLRWIVERMGGQDATQGEQPGAVKR